MKLIISEKAIAGKKIASILSKNNYETISDKGVNTFKFTKDKVEHLLIPLRGHINTVDFLDEDGYWSIYKLDLLADKKFIYKEVEKSIISSLKKQRKDLEEIIIATDADREGEAIGLEAYNYVKIKHPKAKLSRAYFSALTETEVGDAFKNLRELDFNFAYSVFTRQEIDLLWGAILTRYLSVVGNRKGKMFLSAGRVQTPLLNLIVERELERDKFVPEKYRVIKIIFEKDKLEFEGTHKNGKMFDIETADQIYEKIKDAKKGIVISVSKTQKTLVRPPPFNTTSFLRAATSIGISATKAMSAAESLYQQGFISYPRTDNTVYPPSLDLKGILNKLKYYDDLEKDVEEILKKPLKPSRGKKQTTDHPPIHPVELAGKLIGANQKVYDIIVRRFLATLSTDAKTENLSIIIGVEKEPFIVNGQIILDPGWKKIYIYSQLNEVILPPMKKDDIAKIKDKQLEKKETTPPPRYTEGGLIKLMEEQNLGTKSTRPAIIQKLRNRDYIQGTKNVEPTKIAISVCSVLNKSADIITKPKLTADTEKEMDAIAAGKKEKDKVVNETRAILHEVVKILVKEKDEIAKELKGGIATASYIGKCPKCGKNLVIRHGRTGKQFVGCSRYPSCRVTYPLPQRRVAKPLDAYCELCSAPMVLLTGGRSKDLEFCLDPKCKSKEEYIKQMEERKKAREEKDKQAEKDSTKKKK